MPPRPPHFRLRGSSLSGAPQSPLSPESVTSPETEGDSADGPPTPATSFRPLAPVYTPAAASAAAASADSSAVTPPDAQQQPHRQQIMARGRYGAGGVAKENGATPRSSAAPSPRQDPQPQPQPQQPQGEPVHEAAAQTLKLLRESRDPAVAPFAAAAAELFGNDGAAGRGQQQPTLQQQDLGLLGNVLMGQLRASVVLNPFGL